MQKRGQLTLLIILGIVIVSLVTTVYYFREDIFVSDWERQRAESLTVPQEAMELNDAVTVCVEQIASESLNILGQQGGYIVIPEDSVGDQNLFSNSLDIFYGSGFRTTYWFYQAANGVDKSQVPTIEFMQQELSNYMNGNLASCVETYDLFGEYNATVGNIDSEVEIQNDQVLFTVNYPVKIVLEDYSYDLDSFYVSQNVPLGSLYDYAVEIMDAENKDYNLEELSYDSLVLYDEQVPLSWTEFNCEEKSWNVEDVENNLKTILVNNVLAVKVRGTDYDLSSSSDKNYFEWELLRNPSKDINVNLMASSNWPFLMQVYPSEGEELKEDTLTGVNSLLGGLFCMNSYNFVYDIKYPVLISLYDQKSGYRFQFATQVILDNNQPRENSKGVDIVEIEDTICGNVITPVEVKVNEVDEDGYLTGLEGAEVSFKCVNNVCPIGETDSSGSIIENVPQCVNGQIFAKKDGYQENYEIVTTLESTYTSVTLEKYYNLTYEIKVVDSDGSVRDPITDETLFVNLEEQDTKYSLTLTYPYQSENILLIPGTYDVSSASIGEMGFDLETAASSFTKCNSLPQVSLGGLFGLSQDTSCGDVEVDSNTFSSGMNGGASGVWYLDRYDLQDSSHVIFYVTSLGSPDNAGELEEVYNYADMGFGFMEPELE